MDGRAAAGNLEMTRAAAVVVVRMAMRDDCRLWQFPRSAVKENRLGDAGYWISDRHQYTSVAVLLLSLSMFHFFLLICRR